MPVRTLGPEGGWIVRSHIDWGGERNILYKGMETSPYQTCFKNLEGKPENESPKRTISASGGLRPLQYVEQCLLSFLFKRVHAHPRYTKSFSYYPRSTFLMFIPH